MKKMGLLVAAILILAALSACGSTAGSAGAASGFNYVGTWTDLANNQVILTQNDDGTYDADLLYCGDATTINTVDGDFTNGRNNKYGMAFDPSAGITLFMTPSIAHRGGLTVALDVDPGKSDWDGDRSVFLEMRVQ